MKRSFSIAVSASVALHGALVLLVLREAPREPEPSPVLSFDLAPPQRDARAARDSGAAANDEPRPASVPVSESTAAADTEPPLDAGSEPLPKPMPAARPTTASAGRGAARAREEVVKGPEPAVPPRMPEVKPGPPPTLEAAATVTAAPTDRAVPRIEPPLPATRDPAPAAPAGSAEPMTSDEREMLDERVADWAEHLPETSPAAPVVWEHDGQRYVATFTRRRSDAETGIGEVVVDVATVDGGEARSARIRLKRLAFSSFAQFVDRWDPGVRLHDDEIDGWFHSNSEITVAPSHNVSPKFLGKVTASRGVHTDNTEASVKRSAMFLGGLETGVRRIDMPKASAPFDDAAPRPEDVHRFTDDAWITFYSDGSYAWADAQSAAPGVRLALPRRPFYFVGAPKKALHVKGTVKGKVLVYSPDTIVIDGDLVYADDPHAGDSGDLLGLVADKNVVVAAPDVTGPGDLSVDASIYARRRFQIRGYGVKEDATLAIYGSLTAGTLSASEPRYRTHVEFDPRLEARRAPGFPLTDRYEVEDWRPQWNAAELPDR